MGYIAVKMNRPAAALCFFLCLFCAAFNASAQERIDVTFETAAEGKVLIHYFLHDQPDKEYEIDAELKKTGEPSFSLKPKNMTGDIGTGKFAGRQCTITWNVDKSEEDVLGAGEDFYFEVTAEEVKAGSSWYWYVLGAAALGGGAATYLLLKKDNKDNTSAASSLAAPPGRP